MLNRTEKSDAKPAAAPRGFKEALSYVAAAWLPVNPDLLERVKSKLQSGLYNHDRNAFLDDIRPDFSLYAHCLRGIHEAAPEADRSVHPIKLFKTFEIEKIQKLVEGVTEDKISRHRFEQTAQGQAHRIRHSLITCGTVQVLAKKAHVDQDEAFSSALLRQFGYLLVAWNYPRTFQKAVGMLSAGTSDLEALLFKFLGFSPTMLGVKSCVDWSESGALFTSLGFPTKDDNGKPIYELSIPEIETAEEVSQFYDIGEALARVNDPDHYPAGKREWDQVVHDITDQLGPDGLHMIRDHIAQLGVMYRGLAPKIFEIDVTGPTASKPINSVHGIKLLATNAFLRRCPEHVQTMFRDVYGKILSGQVSIEALNLLVKEVIPGLGFIRGCIYLGDGDGSKLVPRLKIGNIELERFKMLRCGSQTRYSHPVLEAYYSQFPIKQENVLMYGDQVSLVAGLFGNQEKNGVLYLELSSELLEVDSAVSLLYFKAIRDCLNHCLNLAVSTV